MIARFDYLKNRMPPISVIPTCADLDPLSSQNEEPHRMVHSRSAIVARLVPGTCSTRRSRCSRRLRLGDPDARLLVVNRNEHTVIREAIDRAGIASRPTGARSGRTLRHA